SPSSRNGGSAWCAASTRPSASNPCCDIAARRRRRTARRCARSSTRSARPLTAAEGAGSGHAMGPNAPSQTAEAVCLMRATEQRRAPAERIVDDPYAKLFLGRLSRAALASWEASGTLGNLAERLSPGLTAYVLARHRFIDDRLGEALAGGVE